MAKKEKTEKKYPDVKLTFHPQFSAATRKTLFLRRLTTELIGNKVEKTYEPLIEGLPEVLTVEKDEVITVTADQFLSLYKYGFIDTPNDLRAKREEFYSIGTQSGVDPKEHRSAESLSHLYDDNLIRIA